MRSRAHDDIPACEAFGEDLWERVHHLMMMMVMLGDRKVDGKKRMYQPALGRLKEEAEWATCSDHDDEDDDVEVFANHQEAVVAELH